MNLAIASFKLGVESPYDIASLKEERCALKNKEPPLTCFPVNLHNPCKIKHLCPLLLFNYIQCNLFPLWGINFCMNFFNCTK